MPDVYPSYSIKPCTALRPGIYPQEPDREEVLGFSLRVRAEVVFARGESVPERMLVSADELYPSPEGGTALYRYHEAQGATPVDALDTVMRAYDRDGFEMVSAELDKMTAWRESLNGS